MNKTFAIALAGGVAVMAVAITAMLYMQRGARMGLTSQVLKVRTASLDENSSVVVLDFRITNPSYVVFVIRSVKVILENNDGKQFEGQTIAEQDAKRLFEGIPVLGQKFNDTLVIRERVAGGSTADRMVAARFAAPLSIIEARKRFLIRIEDADGQTVTELSEK